MEDCYWEHKVPANQLFGCLDRETKVCSRCCVEKCSQEAPEWFAECASSGHPTWPLHTKLLPKKLVCLESSWDERVFKRTSVKGFLKALSPMIKPPLQVAHQFIASADHLEQYVNRETGFLWADPDSHNTPVYYLSFHGSPGAVHSEIDRIGSPVFYKAFKKFSDSENLIYFGSCSVLRGKRGTKFAEKLLSASGTKAIIGYTKDVDWMDSMMVDLLFFYHFFSDLEPWKNLEEIFSKVKDSYQPASEMGYILFLSDGRVIE